MTDKEIQMQVHDIIHLEGLLKMRMRPSILK